MYIFICYEHILFIYKKKKTSKKKTLIEYRIDNEGTFHKTRDAHTGEGVSWSKKNEILIHVICKWPRSLTT